MRVVFLALVAGTQVLILPGPDAIDHGVVGYSVTFKEMEEGTYAIIIDH